jgi:tetratricopeptide (TPR) repeat protein
MSRSTSLEKKKTLFPNSSDRKTFRKRRGWLHEIGRINPIVGAFFVAVLASPVQTYFGTQASSDVRIESYIEEAQRATTAGNLRLAIQDYRRALSLNPNLPEVETNLGLMLFLTDEYREATNHFKSALRQRSDLFPAKLFLGMALAKLGEADNAIVPLRDALAQEPSSVDARLALCSAYSNSSKPEAGLSECFAATRVSSTNPEAWYGLGSSALRAAKLIVEGWAKAHPNSPYLYILKGESYREQEKFAQAVLEYRKASHLASIPPEGTHLALGETYLAQGDFESAKVQFDSIPRDSEGLNLAWGMVQLALAKRDYVALGSWLHEMEKTNPEVLHNPPWFVLPSLAPESVRTVLEDLHGETLQKVLSEPYRNFVMHSLLRVSQGNFVFPENLKARSLGQDPERNAEPIPRQSKHSLARLRRNWDFLNCANSFKTLERLPDVDSRNLMDFAICEWGLGDFEEALQTTSGVLRMTPQSEKATYWKIKILLQISKLAFGQLGHMPSGTSRVHELLAKAYESKGMDTEAAEEYRLALQSAPDNLAAYLSLGELLYRTAHFKEAAETFGIGLSRSPNDPDAHFGLGRTYLKLGRPELAIEHLRDSLLVRADWPAAHEVLGQAYRQLGRYADAITEFKKAINLDPDGSIHYQLFQMYEKVGQKNEADLALQESMELRKKSRDEREKALQKELELSNNP